MSVGCSLLLTDFKAWSLIPRGIPKHRRSTGKMKGERMYDMLVRPIIYSSPFIY